MQEAEIEAYIKQAASIFFGLSPEEIRSLAYQCAQMMNISMPSTWAENELAGPDWFTSFMKRHPGLALRTPECTSLARASAFNREHTKLFFTKLSEVLELYNFQAKNIWNVDESGISTVQKPRTIVAPKGTKQVGAITSAERGQTVTLCGAISAVGTFVRPMFVFPRIHFKDHCIRDGPPGCCGAAHPSAWMVADLFVIFLHHFVAHVRPSKVLLLLDNHASHLGTQGLKYVKANGVIMLSFSPALFTQAASLRLFSIWPLEKSLNCRRRVDA